jgi:hypothetical protein
MNEQIEKIRRAHEFGISAANHKLCINSEWTPVEKVFDILLTYITDLEKQVAALEKRNSYLVELDERAHGRMHYYADRCELLEKQNQHLVRTLAEPEQLKSGVKYKGTIPEGTTVSIIHNETLEEAAKVGVKLKLGGCSIEGWG